MPEALVLAEPEVIDNCQSNHMTNSEVFYCPLLKRNVTIKIGRPVGKRMKVESIRCQNHNLDVCNVSRKLSGRILTSTE